MPYVILVLGVAGIVAFVMFAGILTYSAILVCAGMGIGVGFTVLGGYEEWKKWKVYEDQKRQYEREQEHRRTVELVNAIKGGKPLDEIVTLSKREVPRLERRK